MNVPTSHQLITAISNLQEFKIVNVISGILNRKLTALLWKRIYSKLDTKRKNIIKENLE